MTNRLKHLSLFLLPVAILVLAVGCGAQSTFDTAGPVSELQKNLLLFVFAIATVVFVLVEGLIVFIALRYRRRSRQEGVPKQVHGNLRLEVLWTIIPALILAVIAVPTVQAIWDLARDPCEDGSCLEVEAVGHRWWFEFRYPTKEIVTSNELRIPTNTPIKINLPSQDVVHSFWVPRLGGKVDMVPNQNNVIVLEADEPGTYIGQCAEFCGDAHAKMRFEVIAMTPEDFESWSDNWFIAPEETVAAMPGAELFAVNCSTCHTTTSYRFGGYSSEISQQDTRWKTLTETCGISPGLTKECGAGVGIVSAPNLTHFSQRGTIGAGWEELTRDSLISWIKDPSSIKDDTYMQAFAKVYQTEDGFADLSDEQIEQVADYLLALRPATTDKTAVASR